MNINDIKIEDNSRFLTLQEGENRIRIVSDFVTREVEFKTGPTIKYSCFVIDRRDRKIKIANFGSSIIKKIQTLAQSKDGAFGEEIPKYDMTIVRKGTGMETSYDVLADRNDTELTAEEVQLVVALPPIEKAFTRDGEINVDEIPF